MKKKTLYALSTLLLASCATTSEQTTMSAAELSDCLQPNRRAVVEINGRVAKPPAKKPAAKPEAAAGVEAKPAAKPEAVAGAEAKPAAPAKPAKPELMTFEQTAYVQGNSAFDPNSAVLKDGGKAELDQLVATIKKRAVQVGAIIISGHTDRLEAERGNSGLAEARAKAVKDYLGTKGLDEKLMFWEGKDAKEPVPVTKFCT